MKKLFLIFTILILLFGCPDPGGDDTPTIPDPPVVPDDPPVIDPPIDPAENPVLLSLFDGEKMMYYDGTEISIAYYDDNINCAGLKMRSIGDVLYHFDEYGNPLLAEWLPAEPTEIISIPNTPAGSISYNMAGSIVYQDEVWILEDIPPAEAYAMGAQYKHYTQVYHNLDIIGLWYMNEWEVREVIKPLSDDVIAIDTLGTYHNLTGSEIVYYALNNGIMIYNFNVGSKTAKLKTDTGNYDIAWSLNFFNSAKWQLANGVWYSHNGYTWDSVNGLEENNTTMSDWNQYPFPVQEIYGEAPLLIPAGIRFENSIDVIYWIECNTGTLIKYIPGIDDIIIEPQIYLGDGYRITGVEKSTILKPVIIGNYLYFHNDNNIMRYNFITSVIDIFSGEMELDKW